MDIVNIASYRFVSIADPLAVRDLLRDKCAELGLKGTIVLAEEGINLFLAGERKSIDAIVAHLADESIYGASFRDLDIKESFSTGKPFGKMVVRVAKEIITMRHPMIKPETRRAPFVEAATLKRWLDQGHDDDGREIVMLDTRNSFEVEMGTFDNAVQFDIEKFSQFPERIKDAAQTLQDKTVVSFCTGGIRCEKAALYMTGDVGLPRVYQLDGGILRYFEEVGGAHYQGECFVFDERVAVDPTLAPTTKTYIRN